MEYSERSYTKRAWACLGMSKGWGGGGGGLVEFWELYLFYIFPYIKVVGNFPMYSNISHEVGTYPEGNKGGLVIVPPSKICTAKMTINRWIHLE